MVYDGATVPIKVSGACPMIFALSPPPKILLPQGAQRLGVGEERERDSQIWLPSCPSHPLWELEMGYSQPSVYSAFFRVLFKDGSRGARGEHRAMASRREHFSLSGPLHLTSVDWENPDHRRSVAASLVRGVCVLEFDRQQKRQGPRALAPPWWDFFHFQLIRVLVHDADLSIFGAIYKFKFPSSNSYYSVQNPPRYVVAFRGTIPEPATICQDIKLNLQFPANRLGHSNRFQQAMQAVQSMVDMAGAENIWLTGHSLGAAIAMLAGKNMAKTDCFVETYLFNPPFPSAPIEQITNETMKLGIRFASSVVTAAIADALNGQHQRLQNDDSFVVLSSWIPYLFVNLSDPICSEYIGYFEHRMKMMEIGAIGIARLATQNSIGSLLSGALKGDSEPSHLLPSVYLIINLAPLDSFRDAHGLQQWWKPNTQCQFKLHKFKELIEHEQYNDFLDAIVEHASRKLEGH